MKFLKHIIFTGLTVGLAACGAKNAGDVKQGLENVKASPVTTQQSNYASACSNLPKVKAIGPLVFLSSRTTIELSSLEFKRINSYYSTLGCSAGNESLQIIESGKTKVQSTPHADGEPTQEDFAFDKTFVKPIGSVSTEILNKFNACGLKNNEFAAGVETNVTAEASGEHCVGQPAVRTALELVLVKDNQLFLGADMEKDQRPDKLDFSTPYTKTN